MILLAVSIICFSKEPKITAVYKEEKIFGRVYAYFTLSFAVSVPLVIVNVIAGSIKGSMIAVYLIAMVIFGAAAVYMCLRVYKKAPAYLKKRCILDLFICGFGVSFRLSLLFLRLFIKTWFTLTMPTEHMLVNGQRVYIFPDGSAYNPATGKTGRLVDNNRVRFD